MTQDHSPQLDRPHRTRADAAARYLDLAAEEVRRLGRENEELRKRVRELEKQGSG